MTILGWSRPPLNRNHAANCTRFTEEELQVAGARGWRKKFDGKEDPMFFVSADNAALTAVKGRSTRHAIDDIAVPLH
jgi:hypothetical protein